MKYDSFERDANPWNIHNSCWFVDIFQLVVLLKIGLKKSITWECQHLSHESQQFERRRRTFGLQSSFQRAISIDYRVLVYIITTL